MSVAEFKKTKEKLKALHKDPGETFITTSSMSVSVINALQMYPSFKMTLLTSITKTFLNIPFQ